MSETWHLETLETWNQIYQPELRLMIYLNDLSLCLRPVIEIVQAKKSNPRPANVASMYDRPGDVEPDSNRDQSLLSHSDPSQVEIHTSSTVSRASVREMPSPNYVPPTLIMVNSLVVRLYVNKLKHSRRS